MGTASLTVALAGNPNCGKTTIFNNLTGARQHVGNYPGVTVERREGFRKFDGKDILMVDLPGTYSLTAQSLDEIVARNVIIDEKPDIIVNILDASNLERNLYLAVQLLELERPVILGLNMADVAEDMGVVIDDAALSRKLDIPVVRMVGNRNRGTTELLEVVSKTAKADDNRAFRIDYGADIEAKIEAITEALASLTEAKYPLRWLAVRLLEDDQNVRAKLKDIAGGQKVLAMVDNCQAELALLFEDDLDAVMAQMRYRFAGEVCREIIVSERDDEQTISDKIDNVLTHRIFGLPIFFGIVWLLFNIVFTVGAYPQGWMEDGFALLGKTISANMADGDLKSLIVDGIIGGVGTVLTFLPNILLLFFGISLLEDSGYMSRAAFLMDRVMRSVGLHGKSFIPLLLGFGCSVPAIMGTRTLENPRDRMVTILVAPLMSCSARLPVYTLLTGAFFSEAIAGTVLFSVYFFGIVLAVGMAMIFRKWLFPGDVEPFVMEMSPYHLPTLRSMLTHMWERSALYLKKAGTLILAASILVWFMTSYPSDVTYSKDFDAAKTQASELFEAQASSQVLQPLGIEKLEDDADLAAMVAELREAGEKSEDNEVLEQTNAVNIAEEEGTELSKTALASTYIALAGDYNSEIDRLDKEQASEKLSNSYAGRLGHFMEPAIKPLGFDWKIGVGLVSAVAAKEVLVSTLGAIYSVGGDENDFTALQDSLHADAGLTPLAAYSLMIFTLIYSPCLAALSVIRRETNSWKWTSFTFVYSTALAWVISFAIFQVGTALGF